MSRKLRNLFFHIYFLNVNISVNMKPKYLKFSLVILGMCMEGILSQNVNIGVSSNFIKCTLNAKKKIITSFPFFVINIKSRAYIKNL